MNSCEYLCSGPPVLFLSEVLLLAQHRVWQEVSVEAVLGHAHTAPHLAAGLAAAGGLQGRLRVGHSGHQHSTHTALPR